VFVGHALLAFALVAGVAVRVVGRRRALVWGAVAAAFAAVPDVDIGYALVGVASALGAGTGDPLALAGAFWSTGNVVHRAFTHSLVLAPAVAALAAVVVVAVRTRGPRTRASALASVLAAGLVAVAVPDGPLAVAVAAAFLAATVGVAVVVARRTVVGPRTVAALALVGLASHPFGDLFTGRPPAMAYPLDAVVVAERVALHPDPTLHLLAAFALELGAIWAATVVYLDLSERRPRLSRGAALGASYAGAALVVPAPTLDLSYPFVFTVLAVGVAGLLPRLRTTPAGRALALPARDSAGLSALVAVTLAWGGYTVAYLAL
jgi:membrane-bound metal-dependent hydrolase YbcI (DUF457 family)